MEDTSLPRINFVSTSMDAYWVIGKSTTHRITPNLCSFITYSYVTPINMRLPNGSTVLTNIAGVVSISKTITLHYVYYIPIFNVNLISGTKFIDASLCTPIFTNKQCFIMQRNSKTPIGLANRHGYLYVFPAQDTTSTIFPFYL